MADVRETAIWLIDGEDMLTISTPNKKRIREIMAMREENPKEVRIKHTNEDGSIVAELPASCLNLKLKRKRDLTDEQREALRERMQAAREKIGALNN